MNLNRVGIDRDLFLKICREALEKAPKAAVEKAAEGAAELAAPSPSNCAVAPSNTDGADAAPGGSGDGAPIDACIEKLSHCLAVAAEYFGMDRHVELYHYLGDVIRLLDRFGIGAPAPGAQAAPALPADEAAAKGGDETASPKPAEGPTPVGFLKASVLYTEAKMKADAAEEMIADILISEATTNLPGAAPDKAKWTATSRIDSHGNGTYYKSEEGIGSHSFRVVGEVDADPISVVTVLCELDMYKEWFPLCYHSQEAGRVNDLHRFSTFTISCPWPVANRTVFMGGFGVDCLTHAHKKVVIVARSYWPDKEPIPAGITVPPPNPKEVTAHVYRGGFVLEPLPGAKTKVSFVMNVDPRLANIPQSLINYMSGKMIWVLLSKIGSAAKQVTKKGSKYEERRNAQKELYDYLGKRAMQALPPEFVYE